MLYRRWASSAIERIYLSLVALLGLCGAVAVGNYAVTVGSGTTFGSVVVGGTVHYAQQFICDLTTPAQCAAVSAGGAVSVTAAQATAANLNATVVQATGTNLHTVVDSGTITTVSTVSSATLAAETTKVIGTVRNLGNTGAIYDGATGAAVPANAVAAGFSDGTNTVIPRVGAVANVAAATGMTQALGVAQYNATPLTVTDTRYQSLQSDVNGFLKVNVAAGGASGGTSSSYGSAFPATGTAIGYTNGTNMIAASVGAVANVAAATNFVNSLGIAQYNATPLTVTDTRYQSLQSDVNGFLKVNVTNANTNGIAAEASSSPVVISSGQAITGQNVASPTHFLNPCQFNTTPTTITTGNVSPFQCDNGGKLLVNTGTVTVTATNLSANVAQINGVTPLMGNGASGTGAQRVSVSNDSSAIANWGHVATGAAPPTGSTYISANTSGATGGLVQGLIQCDSKAIYDASTNGSTELVALTSGRTVYVCGYSILSGGTVNVKLIYGTGTACATGSNNMTPAWQLTAQVGLVDGSPFSRGLKTASANALCINTSAGVAVQAIVYYAVI